MIFFTLPWLEKGCLPFWWENVQTKKVFLKIAKKVKCVKEALDYAGHNSLPFCGIFWRKKIVTFLDVLQSWALDVVFVD